jgi:transcriptional regulator with XRE-family HTH domain
MTSADLLTIRRLLGLSQTQLAQALGLKSRSTVARWEAGTHALGAGHEKLLKRLLQDQGCEALTTARGLS